MLEVDEGGTPVGKASTTSIAQFLAANPRLATIKAKRVSNGVIKWLLILIFGYLIFSPVLAIIPQMEEPAVVAVLWVIIGAPAASLTYPR